MCVSDTVGHQETKSSGHGSLKGRCDRESHFVLLGERRENNDNESSGASPVAAAFMTVQERVKTSVSIGGDGGRCWLA